MPLKLSHRMLTTSTNDQIPRLAIPSADGKRPRQHPITNPRHPPAKNAAFKGAILHTVDPHLIVRASLITLSQKVQMLWRFNE